MACTQDKAKARADRDVQRLKKGLVADLAKEAKQQQDAQPKASKAAKVGIMVVALHVGVHVQVLRA